MSTIYTRGGDDGTTSLGNGSRARKDGARIQALGDLDEANSLVGLARVGVVEADLDRMLEFVQQRIFNASARLATPNPRPDAPAVTPEDVESIERAIDRYTERAGALSGFILPGFDETTARLHVARSAMRRAERSVVRLSAKTPVEPAILAFMNRASDLLFAAARVAGDGNETRWNPEAPRP